MNYEMYTINVQILFCSLQKSPTLTRSVSKCLSRAMFENPGIVCSALLDCFQLNCVPKVLPCTEWKNNIWYIFGLSFIKLTNGAFYSLSKRFTTKKYLEFALFTICVALFCKRFLPFWLRIEMRYWTNNSVRSLFKHHK